MFHPFLSADSNGLNLFLDAVKQRRHRRDTVSVDSSSKLKLESLLLDDVSNAHIVEFDLVLDDDQFGTVKSIGEHVKEEADLKREKRKAVRHSIYHWPGAVVPYEIHSSVGECMSYYGSMDLVKTGSRSLIKTHRVLLGTPEWGLRLIFP